MPSRKDFCLSLMHSTGRLCHVKECFRMPSWSLVQIIFSIPSSNPEKQILVLVTGLIFGKRLSPSLV
ncbi:rCG60866 [Rattus norvegicus]|uniref:RCG60866 n=1 Tax=Rattus norvegicus TaxID=10116 RepID=A6JK19_RAT|nr:rCG60866 [Rattus norvegicus]